MLEGENVREGFINVADFEAAAALIKNEHTRDTVQFQYGCAWRSKEVAGLEWSKVDLTDWVIRLSQTYSQSDFENNDQNYQAPKALVRQGAGQFG